jgi:GMP reductase
MTAFVQETKWDFADVLIRPNRSKVGSRSLVNLIRMFKMLHSGKELIGLPIIVANLDTTGTIAMCEALSQFQAFTLLHKFYSKETLIKFFKDNFSKDFAFYTMGITNNEIQKLKEISEECHIKKICIDAANGYTQFFVEQVAKIRELMPYSVIMAGNCATPEMVQEIVIVGKADIVKIGIGPGKFCKTREVTGCGYYQLSAALECSNVAHGLQAHVAIDGGMSVPGDICKAIGAGGDMVVLGGIFSGHDECEGEWEMEYPVIKGPDGVPVYSNKQIKKSLKVYGMSSEEAQIKYYGGLAEHRASEGRCMQIPYKGPVQNTMQQIMGGLRSYCTYIGADDIKHAAKCTTFITNK